MKYKTLLFDADGTLLDFMKSEEMALIATFTKYEIPYNKEIKKMYETINHDLWNRFELGEIDKQTVLYTRFGKLFKVYNILIDGVQFEEDYQKALGEGAYLINGALEIVAQLAKVYDLYIVTNGVSKTQYSRLKETGLSNFMNDVFVSEDIGFQKPRKEYFDYVFSHIPGFKKQQAIIIGDSLSSDILGGMQAGIDTCWYNPSKQTLPTEYGITYHIKQLKELLTLFLK